MTKQGKLELVIVGGIHATAPVSEEPEITLSSWRVYLLSDGVLHLSGWHEEGREGRASSRVDAIDAASAIAITGSGRRYVLNGWPGYNSDASYVWQGWLRMNEFGPGDATDVTAEIWADIQAAQCNSAAPDLK